MYNFFPNSLEDNANYASSNSSNSPKIPFSTFTPIAVAANNNNSPARKPPMAPQVLWGLQNFLYENFCYLLYSVYVVNIWNMQGDNSGRNKPPVDLDFECSVNLSIIFGTRR